MSADLAVIAGDPAVLDTAADPGEYLMAACERARTWLAEALAHGDIAKIAEFRSRAEAIRVHAVSRQLGTDAQLKAAEIVRRAERCLGQAVRRGQAGGTVMTRADGGWNPPRLDGNGVAVKTRPGDYVGHGGTRVDIYAMTDDVTDGEFDRVIDQARDEGNLARAHVAAIARRLKERIPDPGDRSLAAVTRRRELMLVRAGQGWSSRQTAALLGVTEDLVRRTAAAGGYEIRADAVLGRGHRIDSNRIVSETAGAMEGIAAGLRLVNPGDLDPARAPEWARSLTATIRAVSRLIRQLKEVTPRD